MLCNISQNAMRQRGGYLTGYPPQGGTLTLPGGYPDPPWWGTWLGTPQGGTWTPPGGVPDRVPPGGVPGLPRGGGTWPGTPPGGGTQVGQQKEYSLHGGRYASCVHAGGLSCFKTNFCFVTLQERHNYAARHRRQWSSIPILIWFLVVPDEKTINFLLSQMEIGSSLFSK